MDAIDPAVHRQHCIWCAGTGTLVLMDDQPELPDGPGKCPHCMGAGAVMAPASTRFAVTFIFDDEVEAREFERSQRPSGVRETIIAKVGPD
jgi:hypothetical protein